MREVDPDTALLTRGGPQQSRSARRLPRRDAVEEKRHDAYGPLSSAGLATAAARHGAIIFENARGDRTASRPAAGMS